MSMDPREMFPPMDLTPEQIVDPIIKAFETLGKATVESDRSLLELINALTIRLIALEDKVNLLTYPTKGQQ
jgi:hypothetical protein